MDDDYVHGGCNLHGLYAPDRTPMTVTLDFAAFCKLAVRAIYSIRKTWSACCVTAEFITWYSKHADVGVLRLGLIHDWKGSCAHTLHFGTRREDEED